MFENYASLIETASMDVANTTHLLHHRGRPTVTHILAGLEQLRCRGRTDALRNLMAQAEVFLTRNQLAQPSRLVVATGLAASLWSGFDAVARCSGLTPRTASNLAAALAQHPACSLQVLVAKSGLNRATVTQSLRHLRSRKHLHLHLARGEIYAVTDSYLKYVEVQVPVATVGHQLVVGSHGLRAQQVGRAESPFERIYDPFGYRTAR